MSMQEPNKQIDSSDADDNDGSEGSGGGDSRPLLSDLFWRDEILQVMYWYQGEGFGNEVAARDLATFLTPDVAAISSHLEQMVEDGFLQRHGTGPSPHYSFTEFGAREGARRFADEFSDVTKQAHGDCPPDCPICKDLPPEDCVHCRSQEGQVYAS